jgi:serine/threonine-protein kinase
MGTVYKANDLVLDETVAIKVLRPDYALDPKMAKRFKTEIKLARKVRHKNVCSIHDYGEYKGFLYISMELIEGVDLKRIMREKGTPPVDECYDLAIQVAEGLQAVHDAGIIHRDLKASNIMRDKAGTVRLMDFGVAKQYGTGGTITSTGQVVGTPEYMSPEQAQGHKLDFRSDVYALGVLIYELFTGQVPFRGDTPISTILKHIHEQPPIYGRPSSKIPTPLLPLLRRALAKNPNERQSSVKQVIEELKRARREPQNRQMMPTAMTEGTTLLAPTPANVPVAEPEKGSRRPRRWILALAAAGFVAIALGAYQIFAPAEPDSIDTDSGVMGEATRPTEEKPSSAEAVATTSEPSPSEHAPAPPPTSVVTSTSPPTTAATTSIPAPRTTSTLPATTTSVASTSIATTTSIPSTTTLPAGEGWVQVAVVPWGQVWVDGKDVGTTPLGRISLSAGSHTIRVRHPDYEIIEQPVDIKPDKTERVIINFRRDGKKKQ